MAENHWTLDKDIDLVYSPDDNGYYFQRYNQPNHRTTTSKVYATKAEALQAYKRKLSIVWSD